VCRRPGWIVAPGRSPETSGRRRAPSGGGGFPAAAVVHPAEPGERCKGPDRSPAAIWPSPMQGDCRHWSVGLVVGDPAQWHFQANQEHQESEHAEKTEAQDRSGTSTTLSETQSPLPPLSPWGLRQRLRSVRKYGDVTATTVSITSTGGKTCSPDSVLGIWRCLSQAKPAGAGNPPPRVIGVTVIVALLVGGATAGPLQARTTRLPYDHRGSRLGRQGSRRRRDRRTSE